MKYEFRNTREAGIVLKTVCGIFLLVITQSASSQIQLSLEQAVSLAREGDPWLTGSLYQEEAVQAQSTAAGELPDPVVSLGIANLPIDSFHIGQEQMTQFKVGVSQDFPRGDSRMLKRQQLDEMSGQHPYLRQNRMAGVTVAVSNLWLETYRNREAIRLIEQDRFLFEHLVNVAQSNYTSAVGETRQQDLLRAQLELTRLEDRLTLLQEQQETSRAEMNEWLQGTELKDFVLSVGLPTLSLVQQGLAEEGEFSDKQLIHALLQHPLIKSYEQKIMASHTGIQLSRQKYKPRWGLNTSYGYRNDDPLGNDRSHFFSMDVTFDLPLFTSRRQDKEVQSAIAEAEAIKTDKTLALRSMRADFESAQARLHRLDQRKTLYEDRLLQEIHDHAEASLTAYTNDDGEFSDVVRARIAELNANIDFLHINIDRLKTIAELNYFLVASVDGQAREIPHE